MNTLRMRLLRTQKGLTQVDLADLVGVSRPKINSWECGRSKPNPDSLVKLAAALGCTVDYLLGSD